jgi:hypothetical protein
VPELVHTWRCGHAVSIEGSSSSGSKSSAWGGRVRNRFTYRGREGRDEREGKGGEERVWFSVGGYIVRDIVSYYSTSFYFFIFK